MPQNKSIVGVVIPSYNRREALKDTICSIFGQTFPGDRIEIIVVDDGSTDGTEEMINDLNKNLSNKVTYVKQENKGAASARNRGGFNAKGDFIFFIDSDCIAMNTCLENLIDEANKDGKIAAVGCKIIGIANGFFAKCHDYAHYNSFTLNKREKRKFLCSSAFLVRKKQFEEVNGFDESYLIAEEEDFGLRMFNKGYDIIYQPNAIVFHNHDRVKFKDLLHHARVWARKGGVRIFLKYNKSQYGKISFKNPYFYIFAAPLIAFLVTLKIVIKCFHEKRILLYAPFIFLNKLAWCAGTYEYLRTKNEDL